MFLKSMAEESVMRFMVADKRKFNYVVFTLLAITVAISAYLLLSETITLPI